MHWKICIFIIIWEYWRQLAIGFGVESGLVVIIVGYDLVIEEQMNSVGAWTRMRQHEIVSKSRN